MSFLPVSPAQAAVLGMPTVGLGGGPQMGPQLGGFPMSPAQAAVLGQAAPAVTMGAPMGAPPPMMQPMQPFTANPMADYLLASANRDEPITTGAGLIGRIGQLALGTRLQQQNIAGEEKYRAQALSQLQSQLAAMPESPYKQAATFALVTGDIESAQKAVMAAGQFTGQQQLQGQGERAAMERQGAQIGATAELGALDREAANARATLSAETQKLIAGEQINARAAEEAIKREHDVRMQSLKNKMQPADYSQLNSISKEFKSEAKDISPSIAQYTSLINSLERGNPADAYASIIGFAKLIEPSAIVTEGDTQQIKATGGLLGQLAGIAKGIQGQNTITPEVRRAIAETTTGIMADRLAVYEQVRDGYVRQASSQGYDMPQIDAAIPDYSADYLPMVEAITQKLQSGAFGAGAGAPMSGSGTPAPGTLVGSMEQLGLTYEGTQTASPRAPSAGDLASRR